MKEAKIRRERRRIRLQILASNRSWNILGSSAMVLNAPFCPLDSVFLLIASIDPLFAMDCLPHFIVSLERTHVTSQYLIIENNQMELIARERESNCKSLLGIIFLQHWPRRTKLNVTIKKWRWLAWTVASNKSSYQYEKTGGWWLP